MLFQIIQAGRTLFPGCSSGESPSVEMHGVLSAKSGKPPSSESSSRCPTHLAHLRQSSHGELNIISDEEAKPGPSGIQIPKKPKFNIIAGVKERLGKSVVRLQRKVR